MMSRRGSRFTMAVVFVAAVILVAGGAAIASNTGFKLNKDITRPAVPGGQKGFYWTALPYFNPYTNGLDFCQKVGLISSGALQHSLFRVNPNGTTSGPSLCSAAAGFSLTPGLAVRIIAPGAPAPAVPSIIIVGSHNPALSISIPAATPTAGSVWFAPPYHTTAVTLRDVCIQAGMGVSGPIATIGQIFFVDEVTGGPNPLLCNSNTTLTTNVVLGKGYRLRNPAATSFIPAHF
jgi:hypothetical protein